MTNSPNGKVAEPDLAELREMLRRHLAQTDRLASQLRALDRTVSQAVADLMAWQEPSVMAHAKIVGEIADVIAAKLNLSSSDRSNVRLAALLHDVGKVGVAKAVCAKTGDLNDEEWAQMRRHPSIGQLLLAQMPIEADVLLAVRHHHERFDGAGYPDGLIGTSIPMSARIIAVADSFHAMISDRPYGDCRTMESARAEIARCSATQFCPSVVDAFLQISVSRVFARSTAA